jgi:hypothetical protein
VPIAAQRLRRAADSGSDRRQRQAAATGCSGSGQRSDVHCSGRAEPVAAQGGYGSRAQPGNDECSACSWVLVEGEQTVAKPAEPKKPGGGLGGQRGASPERLRHQAWIDLDGCLALQPREEAEVRR